MKDFIFLLPEAPPHLQKTQSYIVSNQRKSIGITNFVFGSIILIEVGFILADAVQQNIFREFLLIKVVINLLSLISLTILFRSLGRNTSKTKNYVAYVISWVLIINEIWSEYYGTYYYEDDGESFPIVASVAAFKVVILQILILSLTINNILKLLPLMCMGTLGLVVISIYLVSLRFLLETIVCLIATIFLGFLLIKREEFLCKTISAGAEELIFHQNIAQTVPIGILLTDRSYQTIYQNNQMQNYFDTLPANLRNPLNLFRQFKGAEVSEEGLVTLIKDAINQRLDGYSSNTMDEVCLEDALDILFKHYKVVENALKGNGPSTTTGDSLSSSIKFYMKNIDNIIEVQVTPIRVGNRECALLLFSDHTEKLSPILGGDESTQYLFLASLSHELKTPLNSALALLQSSLQEVTIPEELKQKLLMPALNSIKILSYNVKDLIDYSKISCGSLGLRLENCNLHTLIEKTIKLVDLQANKKKISIFSKIDPDIPKEWCSDPDRVCQALLNLLSNGLKYTLKGFIVVSAKYLDKRGLIKIKVTDTGLGMEKKDLIKLQRCLRNQDISPKKLNLHSTGIGMGLTVSNEICSILGPPKYDYLRVKSTPNRGSEFTFYIENKTKAHSSIEGNIAIETHESLLSEAKQLSKKATRNRHTTRKESIFSPHRAQRVEREKAEKAYQSKETDIIDLNDDKVDDSLDASSDSSPSLYANTSLLSQRYSSFETNKKSRHPSILKQGSSKKAMKLKRQESEKVFLLERVLIVDDDSFNILSLELMFKNLKIPHDHAYNGQEAIEKVLTNKYDLIMMDCNMPVMDGWEATNKILTLIKEGKVNDMIIVACTAFEDAENLLKCCEAGMKYIIQKPVNQDKLSDLLRKLPA